MRVILETHENIIEAMNIPKISVIVPVYNVEKYLERCLTSLLNQTLKDIEIILVDDGSPDGSGKICDEYEKNHPNIKVIHKVNGGLGYARNSGLEIASGEFVGFIDSDDFIDSEMYEDLYSYAKKESLDTVFSAGFKFYNDGEVKEDPEVSRYTLWSGEEVNKTFIPDIIGAPPTYKSDVKYAMSVCRGIYSLKIIRENKLSFKSEREYLSEDILFNLNYLIKSNKVGMIPKCYYYYCYNEGSLTRSYRPDMQVRMNKLYYAIKKELQAEGLYKYAKVNLDRLYLLKVRGAIKNEFLDYSNKKKLRLKLNHIFEEEILRDILISYPSSFLPIKHRIFFYLLKYKVYFVFRIFADTLVK